MLKILTIVIPTYNMQDYLRRCLDSLIVTEEQMQLLEVLVVNDGSKDNSSAIAHEYQDKYPDTFRVIDKENGNYGSCVNRGLKEATGTYFRILDADDWFDNESLQLLINTLFNLHQTIDVVFTNYIQIYNNNKNIKAVDIPISFDKLIIRQKFFPFKEKHLEGLLVMHCITVRTQKMKDMNYFQQEGISYTDTEFAFYSLLHADYMLILDVNLYNYFLGREGQTMESSSMISKENDFYLISKRLVGQFLQANDLNENEKCNLMVPLSNIVYYFFRINLVFKPLTLNSKHKLDEIICQYYSLIKRYPRYFVKLNICKLSIVYIYKISKLDLHILYKILIYLRNKSCIFLK